MPRSAQDVRILRRARVLALLSAFLLVIGSYVLGAPTAVADGPTTFSQHHLDRHPGDRIGQSDGSGQPVPVEHHGVGDDRRGHQRDGDVQQPDSPALNDIDAMVVAPTGANLVVLSDVGDANGFAFDEQRDADVRRRGWRARCRTGQRPERAPTSRRTTARRRQLPVARAERRRARRRWAAPSPASSANGTWQLFVVDDTNGRRRHDGRRVESDHHHRGVGGRHHDHRDLLRHHLDHRRPGDVHGHRPGRRIAGHGRNRAVQPTADQHRLRRSAERYVRRRHGHHVRADRGHPPDQGHLQRCDRLLDQQRQPSRSASTTPPW